MSRHVCLCAQIPMIVLYVFGIPIVAFIVLRNNRNELHNIDTRRKYSFLYAVRVLKSIWPLHIYIFSFQAWKSRHFTLIRRCDPGFLFIIRVTASAVPRLKMKRAGIIGNWSLCHERLQLSSFRYECIFDSLAR